MRIEFECSGGIANLELQYQADTEQLPQEAAEKLSRLVEESKISELAPNERNPVAGRGADFFTYKLNVDENGQKTSFSFTDVTAPDEVMPLLDHLRALAVEQKMAE